MKGIKEVAALLALTAAPGFAQICTPQNRCTDYAKGLSRRRRLYCFKLSQLSAFVILAMPSASLANPYVKTFNQYMGTASTGESVTLISVTTEFRGGYGTWVKYKIGADTVDSGIACSSENSQRSHFTDQGVRYPRSHATAKILIIACNYQNKIKAKFGKLYDTSP